MNYSEMTDFEINSEVAAKVGGFLAKDIFEKEQTIFKWHPSNKYLKFDPCNSWADAGPIIVSNKISLHAPSLLGSWSAEFVGSDDDVNDGYEVDYFQHRNINPLRAAMIVFLMMQEQPNA